MQRKLAERTINRINLNCWQFSMLHKSSNHFALSKIPNFITMCCYISTSTYATMHDHGEL